ncbi:hypothetical protein BABA_15677 [Neobacillus bataviensis LMG 21833]|uniref:Peptidase M20 dimerisation domain-containing protein n=1 Tax=Neobacillus bataviensis LMG 21833 TaxID=1117379 RepID=K6DES3_9BACI|nr:amidohydrolase [Neobacillus bataviensis]EKN66563.1 hypothetical protein BABA_15677 [Neobacillus bataviensis LMG 21833]
MNKNELISWIDGNAEEFIQMAKQIWDKPEIAYTETFASSLQKKVLEEAGFAVTSGIGGIPTAFIAEYGIGHPIIGFLGEFDALPGLSQQVCPEQQPVVENGPGHGCGHNLLGTAGVAAVIALKNRMADENMAGTIRYYGCPAEEVLSGKTFMARSGAFDDLDCALTWHPGSANQTTNVSFRALSSVEFYFTGRTAHAGSAPHLGRSALDAVELMNVGANYLREHVPDGSRIHYTITNGGQAPNIVPGDASVWYYLRGENREQVDNMLERLIKIAQGAAMMTETSVTWEIKAGCYDTLPNEVLNDLMFAQGNVIGPLSFTAEEEQFAHELAATLQPKELAGSQRMIALLGGDKDESLQAEYFNNKKEYGETFGASTDVGDVTWITPVGQILTACMPVGVEVHTWQATASFGSSIGMKGMLFAAKVMALSGYDLLHDQGGILAKAKAEFTKKTDGVTYKAGIPSGVQAPVNRALSLANSAT